jgi:HEAT repeat protein
MKVTASLAAVLLILATPVFSRAAGEVDRARAILSDGLNDRNPDVRKEATLALGLVGKDEKAAAMVAGMVQDSDVQVRLAAISSIVDLRRRTAIPELKRALDDSVPEVAFAAAKALYTLNQPDGREALLAVLEGARTAESNPLRARFREMKRMFHTPKSAAMFAVQEGLGFVPVPGLGEGVGALQSLVFSDNLSPRASAALLLAKDRRAKTRRALLNALFDDDWSVRAAAAQAIAIRSEPRLRTALIPRLSDSDQRVRYRAAAAYLRLIDLMGRRRSPARNRRGSTSKQTVREHPSAKSRSAAGL